MKKALLIELPAMLVIGAGMFAWAFLLWVVAPWRGRGMLIAGMFLVGLIVATLLIDRKVEAAERQEELEEYIEAICEPRNICPELIEATIERRADRNPKDRKR